jgi:hypothetical protein
MRFTHPVFAKCRKYLLITGDRVARKSSGVRMAKTAAVERIKDNRVDDGRLVRRSSPPTPPTAEDVYRSNRAERAHVNAE